MYLYTTVPSPTPSIYINKDEPHLYTNISKVYLTSLRPYKTILLHCSPGLLDKKDCGFWCPCMEINNVSVQYNGGLLLDIILLTQCGYIGEPV